MSNSKYRLKLFYLQTLRFLRLIRYLNLFIIIFTQYLVAIFLIGPFGAWLSYLFDPKLFILSLATVLIAAAGYIINDYYDIKIDIINKPKRVVVGKFLKRRHAMIIHSVFNFTGICLAFFLGLKIMILNACCAFWLWLYSNQLKRLPFIGNLSVALLTAMSISIVGFYYNKNLFLVNAYAMFAFFISLIREIIKDMEDMKGDEEFGCKTLPIIWGIRKVKYFIYVILVLFVISLFYICTFIHNLQLYYYFLMMLLPHFVLLYKLIKADKKKDFKFLSNLCKLIMLTGVVSMIFI